MERNINIPVNLLMSTIQTWCHTLANLFHPTVFCTVWASNWPYKSLFFLLTSNWRVHHTLCVFLSIKGQIRRRKIQLVNVKEERRRGGVREWVIICYSGPQSSVYARFFGFRSLCSLINASHLQWILHRIYHQSFEKEQNRKFLLQPLHAFIWKGIRSLS